MALFARFRSKERDIEGDVARIRPLIELVKETVRSLDQETTGLAARSDVLGETDEGAAATRLARLDHLRGTLAGAAANLESLLDPAPPWMPTSQQPNA